MAVNAYLVIDGRPGPSTSKKDAIDVLSFAFGGEQTSVTQGSSGEESRAGKAHVHDLRIIKVVDKTSPVLFDDLMTGNVYKKATLFYDKPMGDNQEDYFKIELEQAMITKIDHSGSSENPVEGISLSGKIARVGYNPEDGDGKLAGWVEKCINLQTLKPC